MERFYDQGDLSASIKSVGIFNFRCLYNCELLKQCYTYFGERTNLP
jgi:hypothetical protein